jgi:Domain of unknown function (DUF4265)
MPESLVKVRFHLDSGDWHGCASEGLWAEPVPETECFKILNSPFFTRGINYLDIVSAGSSGPNAFDFKRVERRGGHSTFMILVVPTEKRFDAYWNFLEKIGCSFESTTIELSAGARLLYSVDVPAAADLDEVGQILERGDTDGVWIFQAGSIFEST